jgi:hypothetical protein
VAGANLFRFVPLEEDQNCVGKSKLHIGVSP